MGQGKIIDQIYSFKPLSFEGEKSKKESGHPLVGALSIQGDGEGKEVYNRGRVISFFLFLYSDPFFI